MSVSALLTLMIDPVASPILDTLTGQKVANASTLDSATKYVTKTVCIVGVQFIGPSADTRNIYKQYAQGNIKLVSNFDLSVEYVLGDELTDSKAGQPGQGCVQGLRFFTNRRSTLKYLCTEGFVGGLDLDKPYYVGAKIADVIEPTSRTSTQAKIALDINRLVSDVTKLDSLTARRLFGPVYEQLVFQKH